MRAPDCASSINWTVPSSKTPGADPTEDVFLAGAVEDQIVDPCQGEQLSEQETGRSGADDDDLGSHGPPHVKHRIGGEAALLVPLQN
ncbi:hypothetical protein ABIE76_001327 [Sinorhizobium fredii]